MTIYDHQSLEKTVVGNTLKLLLERLFLISVLVGSVLGMIIGTAMEAYHESLECGLV